MTFSVLSTDYCRILSKLILWSKRWTRKSSSEFKRTKVVCGSIYKNLLSKNSKRRLKTVYFMEILVKHVKIDFHLYLFTESFCKLILKILAKRRKKFLAILNGHISFKKRIQDEIENWLLYLIQLWYDTFMMRYDEFKNIIEVYHKLRKEGVLFPLRNP